MRILLIEDDPGLGAAVRDQIVDSGHLGDWMLTLADADAAVATVAYDLILLDLMLPDGRGLDFLQTRRRAGDTTPVIILTARDQITDRIAGLNSGADDYLVKPFNLAELSARIGAVARRYSGNPNPVVTVGPLSVNTAARRVTGVGGDIVLTQREWVIFETFLQRPGQMISKSTLEDQLYSFDAEVESNTIEVYISRLRKKLGPGVIETHRGLGYRLCAP